MPSSEAIRDFLDARPPAYQDVSEEAKRRKARLAVVMQVFLRGGSVSDKDIELVHRTIDSAERMLPQLADELAEVRRSDFKDEESFARARLLAMRRTMPSDELAAHNYERMTLIEAETAVVARSAKPHAAPTASLSKEERRARRAKIHRDLGCH